MNIQLDDGVQFGLGVFETIGLKNGNPILLKWHLERINRSLKVLGIGQNVTEQEVLQWCEQNKDEIEGLQALKIMVSEKNKLFALRKNPYTEESLERGFQLEYSPIMRNETSPLVYHKTMNYADNIMEKRRMKGTGADEVLFLNSKGQITEGSTTNVFFVKNRKLFTPQENCGLLPGILRRFVMEKTECIEGILYPQDIAEMDECFVTNSLMGIMPVSRLGSKKFRTQEYTKKIKQIYLELLDKQFT